MLFPAGNFSERMERVEVPIVNRDVCVQNLRDTHLGHFFRLDDSMLCAGGERDADACRVRREDGICERAGMTDKQTDEKGRQMDRQTGRQTDGRADIMTDKQTDEKGRQMGRQKGRRTDGRTDRRTDRRERRQLSVG